MTSSTLRSRLPFAVLALLVTLFVTALGGTSFQRKLQSYQPLGFDPARMGGAFVVAGLEGDAVDGVPRVDGLQVGDEILLVNGQAASSTDQLRRLLRTEPESTLLVKRGNVVETLVYLRPERRIDPIYPILVAIGVLYLLIGLYTGLKDRHPAARLFFAWCTASAAFFVLSPTLPPTDRVDELIFWVDQLSRTLLPALTLHLFLVFPTPLFETLRRVEGRGSFSAVTAPIYGAVYLPALALVSWHADQVFFGGKQLFGPATARQLWAVDRIELILIVAMVLLSALGLVVRFRRRPGWEHRRQTQWILLGLVAGNLPFLAIYLLPLTLGATPPTWATVIAVLPLGLVPLAFAWAIFQYRLLDFNTALRDLASYSAVGIVGVFGFQLAQVLIREGVAEELVLARNTLTFAAGLVIAGVLVPTRSAVAGSLERFQHRGLWAQRSLLRSLGKELMLERDIDRLCAILVEKLDEGLVVRTNLYLRQSTDRFLPIRRPMPDDASGGEAAGAGGPATFADIRDEGSADASGPSFRQMPEVLSADALGEDLWSREVQNLSAARLPGESLTPEQRLHLSGYRYAFPIRVRGHRVGILVCSHKYDEDPLEGEDLELIRGLLDQTALAMENARLLDEVRHQLDEVTRLRDWNRGILEASPAGIAVFDIEGVLVSANRAFAELCQANDSGPGDGSELVGLQISEVLPVGPVPDPEDGLVEVGYCDARGEEHHLQLDVAIHTDPISGDSDLRVLVARDVSQRVNMEGQLREKEHLASLGMLAAGVAHEVNTPLTGISSYAQFLEAEIPEGDPKRDILDKMQRQTFRASQIVNNLLDFARNRRGEMGRVDLASVLRETVQLLEHRAQHLGVELSLEGRIEAGEAEVLGNEGELHQVLTNLVTNALDAVSGTSEGGARDGEHRVCLSFEQSEHCIRVAVRDTGPGIPPERLATVFKPFFSSKLGKGGTGLGLAITYNIVRRHGGEIRATNHDDGPGCTFTVELPSYDTVTH